MYTHIHTHQTLPRGGGARPRGAEALSAGGEDAARGRLYDDDADEYYYYYYYHYYHYCY